MSHTKEPWRVAEESFDNDGIQESVIRALGGRAVIAVTIDFVENNPNMREANASRIVACVNACAGITTEGLEATARQGSTLCELMNEQTARIGEVERKLFQAEKQRDELLGALETLARSLPQIGCERAQMMDYANAAIAKAKEGAA